MVYSNTDDGIEAFLCRCKLSWRRGHTLMVKVKIIVIATKAKRNRSIVRRWFLDSNTCLVWNKRWLSGLIACSAAVFLYPAILADCERYRIVTGKLEFKSRASRCTYSITSGPYQGIRPLYCKFILAVRDLLLTWRACPTIDDFVCEARALPLR